MIYLVLLVLLVVVAMPVLRERNRRVMDDSARGHAPGKFATLPQGVTHYRWYGPEGGPVIICVHGLTTPSFVWGGLLKGLTKLGFRVLVYDLFGRGYSDRPRGPQDAAFFQRQLMDLMTHQQVRGRVTLIGYSMGGAIAACYAAAHPDRVRQLVLLAPAGLVHALNAQVKFLRDKHWIGDWLMLAFYPRLHRKGIAAEAHLPSSVLNVTELQEAELNFKGFVPAVLASLRGVLSRDMEPDHRAIAAAEVPMLAIWGREDDVIPLAAAGKLTEWNRAAEQDVIEGAGHGLTYTHADEILAFLGPRLLKEPL